MGQQSTDIYGNLIWLVPSGLQNILAGQEFDMKCSITYNTTERPEMQHVTLNAENHCLQIATTTTPTNTKTSTTTATTTTTSTTTTKDPNYCCGAAISTIKSGDQSGHAVLSLLITACQNVTNGVTLGLR